MKALFLILSFFATFMLYLGYTAKTETNNPLGNALIFGAVAIYLGVIITWVLFRIKERSDKNNNV